MRRRELLLQRSRDSRPDGGVSGNGGSAIESLGELLPSESVSSNRRFVVPFSSGPVREIYMTPASYLRLLALLVVAIALSACSATGPVFTRHTDPASGEALIYLYRPNRWTARAGAPQIFINGQKSIKLLNKGYTAAYVVPGKIDILARWSVLWESRHMSTLLNANSGTTHYVRYLPTLEYIIPLPYGASVTKIRETFGPVEESMALTEIKDCRYIKPDRLRF